MRYVDAILSYRSRLAVVCRAWIRFALLSEISSDRILCDNYFDRSNRSLATAFDCCPVLGSKDWLTTNRAVVWSCIDSSVRSRNRFGCVDWSVRWLSANSKAATPRFLAKVGTMRLAVAVEHRGAGCVGSYLSKPTKVGQRPPDADIKRKVPPLHRSSLCDDLFRSG